MPSQPVMAIFDDVGSGSWKGCLKKPTNQHSCQLKVLKTNEYHINCPPLSHLPSFFLIWPTPYHPPLYPFILATKTTRYLSLPPISSRKPLAIKSHFCAVALCKKSPSTIVFFIFFPHQQHRLATLMENHWSKLRFSTSTVCSGSLVSYKTDQIV